MSDNQNTQGQEPAEQNTNPETEQGQAPEAAHQGDQQEGVAATQAGSLEELPEWARKTIADLRQESASYRTERNRLNDALAAAEQNPEQNQSVIDQLRADLKASDAKAKRLEIAREANLPPEADVMLHGADEDTLRQQAQFLSTLFSAASGSPAQAPAPAPAAARGVPTNPRNPGGNSRIDAASALSALRSRARH